MPSARSIFSLASELQLFKLYLHLIISARIRSLRPGHPTQSTSEISSTLMKLDALLVLLLRTTTANNTLQTFLVSFIPHELELVLVFSGSFLRISSFFQSKLSVQAQPPHV
jgi:hypothetical protein